MLEEGHWQSALARIDTHEGGTDRLLELLQRGHVLHYAGRFDESNIGLPTGRGSGREPVHQERLAAGGVAHHQRPHHRLPRQTLRARHGALLPGVQLPFPRRPRGRPGRGAQGDLRRSPTPSRPRPARFGAPATGRPPAGSRTTASCTGSRACSSSPTGRPTTPLSPTATPPAPTLPARRSPACLRRRPSAATSSESALAYGFRTEVEELRREAPKLFRRAPTPAPGAGGEVVFVLESGWIAPRDQLMLNLPILSIDSGYSSNEAWAWELVDRSSPGWRPPARVEIDYWLTVAVPTMGQPIAGPVTGVRLSGTSGLHHLGAGRRSLPPRRRHLRRRAFSDLFQDLSPGPRQVRGEPGSGGPRRDRRAPSSTSSACSPSAPTPAVG